MNIQNTFTKTPQSISKVLSPVLLKRSIALVSVLLISQFAYASTSIKAEVNGMVCAFCAKGIEKKLKALPEGQATLVDLKSRTVVLELKEGQTVPLERFKKIIQEAGYQVSNVALVNQNVAEIKQQIESGK